MTSTAEHQHPERQEMLPMADTATSSALRIHSLSLSIRRNRESRLLLDGISLHVEPGETVGLVGESGSGKSLTSRAALGLFPSQSSVAGSVQVDNQEVIGATRSQVRQLRQRRAAMVFQDPRASINPVRRIGDFLTEQARYLGISRREATLHAIDLLDEVGIPDAQRAMSAYPHEFSGGMLQRVMIAAALMNEPRLLLADEATTALDVTTQAEVVSLLRRLQSNHNMGILMVTHDLDLAAASCNRIYVMYAGRIVEAASNSDLFARPRHPYTRGLLASSPTVRGQFRPLEPIAGRPAALADAPDGCAFRARCSRRTDVCADKLPILAGDGSRAVACFHPENEANS